MYSKWKSVHWRFDHLNGGYDNWKGFPSLTKANVVNKKWTKSGALGLVIFPLSSPCPKGNTVVNAWYSTADRTGKAPIMYGCDLRHIPGGSSHIWFYGDMMKILVESACCSLLMIRYHTWWVNTARINTQCIADVTSAIIFGSDHLFLSSFCSSSSSFPVQATLHLLVPWRSPCHSKYDSRCPVKRKEKRTNRLDSFVPLW